MSDAPKPGLWNSLEVAKLLISIATPLAVVTAGFIVNESLAKQNDLRRAQERLLTRRLDVFDKVAPNLDSIDCYVMDLRQWQEETPLSVLERKRTVDDIMFRNQAIWAPDTFAAYQTYMNAAFKGTGKDAFIRAETSGKSLLPNWDQAWLDLFTDKDPDHQKKYDALMNLMSRDLDLGTPP